MIEKKSYVFVVESLGFVEGGRRRLPGHCASFDFFFWVITSSFDFLLLPLVLLNLLLRFLMRMIFTNGERHFPLPYGRAGGEEFS